MLLGAYVVDSIGAAPRRSERVLVLSVWSDTAAALGIKSEQADRVLRREMVPRERWLVTAINGKSWPHTDFRSVPNVANDWASLPAEIARS